MNPTLLPLFSGHEGNRFLLSFLLFCFAPTPVKAHCFATGSKVMDEPDSRWKPVEMRVKLMFPLLKLKISEMILCSGKLTNTQTI